GPPLSSVFLSALSFPSHPTPPAFDYPSQDPSGLLAYKYGAVGLDTFARWFSHTAGRTICSRFLTKKEKYQTE
ncbi:MAG: hypothetical protein IJ078_05375, partial [Succinivibrionaceae bacterium]|nr:hypothetical protein [Succinivibrionaceae bacterium]